VVVEIKPVFQMALKNNLAKWTALRQYCAEKGFGLVITTGTTTIQQVQQSPIRPEVEVAILEELAKSSLSWSQYDELRQKFEIKRNEFLALVLRHRLDWRLKPFTLMKRG
jgi:hypothetical protein